ncbi:MAG: MFS transporter [Solirubrobacterales bacterium]|nr:MFS transporter [Solirubrobacterales bacterium]
MSSDHASDGGRVIMTRGLVALFAVACGVCVANLYYSQPLLPLISDNLGSSAGSTALVVTAAQIGYLLGLLFFVPLGDMLVRRRLIPFVMAADAVFLVATAFAPSLYFLIAVTVFVGVAATSAQILVPFAASLAEPERRGSVTGTVMSGLLLGILLARVFSGLIAEVTSWRPVYLIAAALMAILAVVLHRRLPDEEARPAITYGALLRSVANYFRSQRLLQLRSAYGGLVFATFSVIWTSLAFLLVRPPYNYSAATIGLFSLFGVAGALAAAFSGRLADRGWEHRVTGGGLLLLVVSVALLDVGSHELIADCWHRLCRSRYQRRAHPKPAGDLRHRPSGSVAHQHQLHGLLFPRWGNWLRWGRPRLGAQPMERRCTTRTRILRSRLPAVGDHRDRRLGSWSKQPGSSCCWS